MQKFYACLCICNDLKSKLPFLIYFTSNYSGFLIVIGSSEESDYRRFLNHRLDGSFMKLEFIGLKSRVISVNDDVFAVFCSALAESHETLKNEDILVITSKVVALEQGRVINLLTYPVRPDAPALAKEAQIDPVFASLITNESEMILGGVRGAFLTLSNGILQANAGIDKSNAGPHQAILLPAEPQKYAENFVSKIAQKYNIRVGVLVIDSVTRPLRRGTTGMCIGAAGVPAVIDERGRTDLFGYTMHITTRAIADNIASGANIVMGETDESTPFCIVRGFPIDEINSSHKVLLPEDMFIPFDQCLYFKNFHQHPLYKRSTES